MPFYNDGTNYIGTPADKLEYLKNQLEKANKDKTHLEAAIGFLEANPGALALFNSF